MSPKHNGAFARRMYEKLVKRRILVLALVLTQLALTGAPARAQILLAQGGTGSGTPRLPWHALPLPAGLETALRQAVGPRAQTGWTAAPSPGSTWSQQAELTGADLTSFTIFGYSVALSGDTALVGAEERNNDIGAAYVFVRN